MEQFSNWLASDPIYMAVAVVLSLVAKELEKNV